MDRSPIRLDTVVEVDRRRIDALLVEAGRPTETPGVHHDLAVDVIVTMNAHLDALDEVLAQMGVEPLDAGQQVRDALLMYEASLGSEELEALHRAWARHGDAFAAVTDELRQRRGNRVMARLGYDFSERLESHSYHRPRASATQRH